MASIAIVVLDTLRASSFEKHFDWLSGVRFTNAYSTSHWTIPAHASLYTGKYPSEVSVHGKDMALDCECDTLPELFSSEGYRTTLLSANPQIYMWDGWQQGFDSTTGPSNLDPSSEELVDWDTFYSQCQDTGMSKYLSAISHAIRSDSPTVKSIWKGILEVVSAEPNNGGIESIIQRIHAADYGSDEFLIVNTMEAHTPYSPPKEYTDIETPVDVVAGDAFAGNVDNPDEIRQVYDDSVRYLSDRYEELHQELEDDFDYIITLSDHGEMLGEHGMWNHSYGLYPELVHIPLVVSGNDLEDRTDDTVVSILDIHKTVCDLVDIEVESRGQNLLHDPEPRDRLFEYHGLLHWHRDQFARKGVDKGVYEKCDKPLDGFVSKNNDYVYQRHNDEPAIEGSISISEATERLEQLIGTTDRIPITSDTQSKEVSDEIQEQLENLGYA